MPFFVWRLGAFRTTFTTAALFVCLAFLPLACSKEVYPPCANTAQDPNIALRKGMQCFKANPLSSKGTLRDSCCSRRLSSSSVLYCNFEHGCIRVLSFKKNVAAYAVEDLEAVGNQSALAPTGYCESLRKSEKTQKCGIISGAIDTQLECTGGVVLPSLRENIVVPSNVSCLKREWNIWMADKLNSSRHCFPSRAMVELEGGATVRMDHLKIGDVVRVGYKAFSKVFMFTHKLDDTSANFIMLSTASGKNLSLTPGHYIYSSGALVPAFEVQVGSILQLGNGLTDVVTSLEMHQLEGLYNPQTVDGNIVVDDILVSTYTTAVSPSFAHILLTPFRLLDTLGVRLYGLEMISDFPKVLQSLADMLMLAANFA